MPSGHRLAHPAVSQHLPAAREGLGGSGAAAGAASGVSTLERRSYCSERAELGGKDSVRRGGRRAGDRVPVRSARQGLPRYQYAVRDRHTDPSPRASGGAMHGTVWHSAFPRAALAGSMDMVWWWRGAANVLRSHVGVCPVRPGKLITHLGERTACRASPRLHLESVSGGTGEEAHSLLSRSRSQRSFERLHSAHDTEGRPIFFGMAGLAGCVGGGWCRGLSVVESRRWPVSVLCAEAPLGTRQPGAQAMPARPARRASERAAVRVRNVPTHCTHTADDQRPGHGRLRERIIRQEPVMRALLHVTCWTTRWWHAAHTSAQPVALPQTMIDDTYVTDGLAGP